MKNFELEGKSYPIAFNLNTLAYYEEISGKNANEALAKIGGEMSITMVRDLIYAIFVSGAKRAKVKLELDKDELFEKFGMEGKEITKLFEVLSDEIAPKKTA